MEEEAATIRCSPQELVFLAGLLGANVVVGVDDPFWGWLADEIEAAWQGARDSLAGRRFIAADPDGGIVIDSGVATLVGACAFPDASFAVTRTLPGQAPELHTLHVSRRLAVEQVVTPEECRIVALGDAEAAFRRLAERLGIGAQEAVAAPGGSLPEESLRQARALAAEGGAEAARPALERAGLLPAAAAALAETLGRPVANSAVAALSHRETAWEVAGVGFLEGENGLWRLRAFSRGSEPWVEVAPCSAAGAGDAVRGVVRRLLPELLPAGES